MEDTMMMMIPMIPRIALGSLLFCTMALSSPGQARAQAEDEDECRRLTKTSIFPVSRAGLPARKMTRQQALEILVALHESNEVKLIPAPRYDPSNRCRVISPQATDKVELEPTIAGVQFLYWKCGLKENRTCPDWIEKDKGKPKVRVEYPPGVVPLNRLNVRNAVALHRMASMVKERFGATTLYHVGVGSGKGTPTDCHNDGRALDFVGIKTQDGTEYTVWDDWAKLSKKSKFRLLDTDSVAERLFSALYDEGKRNWNDRYPPSQIGDSSEILHPDHPNPAYSSTHSAHMHFDLSEPPRQY